jgi:hypothetical protein
MELRALLEQPVLGEQQASAVLTALTAQQDFRDLQELLALPALQV